MVNIFLDTQVFIEKNFYIEGAEMQILITLAKEGKIKIFTNEIIRNEIQKHIIKKTSEALKKVSKHEFAILRTVNILPEKIKNEA